jgi:uncharacterized protein
MVETILIFVATGAVTGLLAGLFGVGGGLIVVPALVWLLPSQGVAHAVVTQVAIGTSLAVIAVTSISSMLAHHRHGAVVWGAFRYFAPGLALGAVAGGFIARAIHGDALERVVGAGALLIAIQVYFDLKPRGDGSAPTPAVYVIAGSFIGLVSSIIGIGGGSFTVPFLTWSGVKIRNAIGTSAASGVPISWFGAVGFILAGWDAPGRGPWSLGYVSLIAFVACAAASVVTAPLGARLAHNLPPRVLKRAFAAFLVGVGVKMLT